MSQENVEALRRSNAAFNRGERDAAMAIYHPEVEFQDLQPAPDSPERLVGRVALATYWAQWEDAFEDLVAEIDEYIDAGAFVVTSTHWRATGKDTGLPVDLRTADVFEFADGQVVRATLSYANKDEALKAAGLEE